jgi:glutamate synthase (ferredoxin)
VATQNPELRKHFTGRPEFVENYFRFVAEEVRELMATLGFRTMDDMIGRVDRMNTTNAVDHWKTAGLDLSQILHNPEAPDTSDRRAMRSQDHGLQHALDNTLIERCAPAIEQRMPVSFGLPIRNINRTVGTMLGSEITRRWGRDGLPDGTINIIFTGSAGQSFGAFLPPGVTLTIEGDANDFFGKGLSGGRLVISPPRASTFVAEENSIIGNVALYGGTSGEVFVHGIAGERFAVRNSGVHAVVEGIGDHGCEYMTGGRVVILGQTGRNFAAGMSGGIAYVLDQDGRFGDRCNREMVELDSLDNDDDAQILELIARHINHTESARAKGVLDRWTEFRPRFVKVMPRDYKRILQVTANARAESREPSFAELVGSTAN